jgi:hypothetical protein
MLRRSCASAGDQYGVLAKVFPLRRFAALCLGYPSSLPGWTVSRCQRPRRRLVRTGGASRSPGSLDTMAGWGCGKVDTGASRGIRDEIARRHALRYAAHTMQFVRAQTAEWDHADFADAWFQQQPSTYHGHMGKPPLIIDGLAQRHLEKAVKSEPLTKELGELIVMGEEVAQADWDPHHPGQVSIIRCDPVDGTSPLAHTGQGFASVITVESRADSGRPWRHQGGAIVRSDGRTLSWSRRSVEEHHVDLSIRSAEAEHPRITNLGTMPQLMSRDIGEVHRKLIAESGAAVAAQSAKRRQDLMRHFGSLIGAAWYFDFQGGNPSAWQLCKSLIGWTIELNSTTIHDSIYLLAFQQLGGRIVGLDGSRINILDLVEEHAGPDSLEKAVPPYIAYFYDDSLEFVSKHRIA